jgi:hypothetical protein
MIKQILWSAWFLTALAAPAASVASPSLATPFLRLQWDPDTPRDGVPAVCGEVFNDGALAVQHVRLLVEELDGHGRVINRRQMEVIDELPAAGRSYFCVPEPAATSDYRLTIVGADSMSTSEP